MTTIEQFLIWRRRAKLSQLDAARALGTSRTTIQRIERGEASPFKYLTREELPVIASPGEELWLWRRRHGLTKAQAARILDCSEGQVYMLEHDKTSMDYRDLEHIEQAYRSFG